MKILEGVYDVTRPAVMKKLMCSRQVQNICIDDKVPDVEGVPEDYKGKKIKKILYNDKFKKEFRDVASHYKLDNLNSLQVGDYAAFVKYTSILELLEICCRKVITEEEKIHKMLTS